MVLPDLGCLVYPANLVVLAVPVVLATLVVLVVLAHPVVLVVLVVLVVRVQAPS